MTRRTTILALRRLTAGLVAYVAMVGALTNAIRVAGGT
jgi:hypothetical protein